MNDVLPDAKLYIDGIWTTGGGGRSVDVSNPATGAVLGKLPLASGEDLDRALEAAWRAFERWRTVAPADRTAVLEEAARRIVAEADVLARLTTLELGLPLQDAKSLVMRAVDLLAWDANEGRRLYGRIVPTAPGVQHSVVREPLGPVAAFAPWNGSVLTPCRKIGSALAAGCSIILKPAEETPYSAIALVRIFEEAGLPPGVINLVFGDPAEVSERLIASPLIRLVSFTGSVPVGRTLATQAGKLLKPAIMELGGHAPVIVCADADLPSAAKLLVAAKFFNAGQVCLAPSRVFVEAEAHDAFVTLVAEAMAKIRVGDGLDEATTMGPLANERRRSVTEVLVGEATGSGAVAVVGGKRIEGPGHFFEPTLLAEVPDDARIMAEEPFGPVITVNRFTRLDDALVRANHLPYGLAAFVFTRSAAIANRAARGLEAGVVGINSLSVSSHGIPFGGIKDSGGGREGGVEGVLAHTYAKTIVHAFE